ncbi:hypothetical protein BDZ45DRAFT_113874 [Acephala macrosclerotiorum]|nr:hypothetical protein BDZ45DRAFT_113874 [Acephala macrosclerotiorum]
MNILLSRNSRTSGVRKCTVLLELGPHSLINPLQKSRSLPSFLRTAMVPLAAAEFCFLILLLRVFLVLPISFDCADLKFSGEEGARKEHSPASSSEWT